MLQLLFLGVVALILYLVSDIIKKVLSVKSSSQPVRKGEEVLDISNAWIDLSNLPYQSQKRFLNVLEEKLYFQLHDLVSTHGLAVFPKVRLADIIELTTSASHRSEYLRRLRERNCDFLICQTPGGSPLLLILTESHSNDDTHRQNRDFAVRAAETAGLPHLIINLDRLPDRASLLQSLLKAGLPLIS